MLKRVRWFGAGAVLGVGATVWTHRKIRTTATRYRPSGLAATAAGKARALPGDVRAALHEGRNAMRQREAELRYGLERVAES